jgi:hypothetical protein
MLAASAGVGSMAVALMTVGAVWWLAFLRAPAARTPGGPAVPPDEPDALSSAQVL